MTKKEYNKVKRAYSNCRQMPEPYVHSLYWVREAFVIISKEKHPEASARWATNYLIYKEMALAGPKGVLP